jgi:hypothetical protein
MMVLRTMGNHCRQNKAKQPALNLWYHIRIKCAGNQTLHICNLDNQYNMVRGGTINADQSHNDAQSIIVTHGQTSKTRHHNRSRKVRRENQQQQALGKPKKNAWAATEPKDNDDEDRASDDSENTIGPGPMSSDSASKSESSTDEKTNAKSKEIHARDH